MSFLRNLPVILGSTSFHEAMAFGEGNPMQRTKRILVVGVDTHYGREVVKGILAYCTVRPGWEIHVEPGSSSETMKRSRLALREWRADGIIAHIRREEMGRFVRESGLPAVNVSGLLSDWGVLTVISDNLAMAELTARGIFLDNGFRNFGFFARDDDGRICQGQLRRLLRDAGRDGTRMRCFHG